MLWWLRGLSRWLPRLMGRSTVRVWRSGGRWRGGASTGRAGSSQRLYQSWDFVEWHTLVSQCLNQHDLLLCVLI